MSMNIIRGKVQVNGKTYTLQHPGAYSYYKKQKELQLIDTRGYIQWDTQKLFDYCFGQDGGGGQVVFPEAGATKIDWRNAGLKEGPEIPSLSELRGVWAIILPSFLDGEFKIYSQDPDDKSELKWEWLETAGGPKVGDSDETPSESEGENNSE